MNARDASTVHPRAHERIWSAYLVVVVAIDVVFGLRGEDPGPRWHAATHLVLLAVVLAIPRLVREERLPLARAVFTAPALLFVFSSLAWVLPALHPEPFEWQWIAADRALFRGDPSVAAQALLHPLVVEALQACYAVFYFVPIAVVIAAWRRHGRVAFEQCLLFVEFGFLLSYQGYLLWPTLPPERFLVHEVPIQGLWLASDLHAALATAELHRWNCFPSGHTMLSVMSLVLAWRFVRGVFWVLLPVVLLLVVSTVALRYHYVVDVLAGLLGVPLAFALGARVIRT
ncbi:MAG: phosphatase PAP2 family protein [Planctomycetes bacterium]|nr:phosphatase PAP2 family protein [Planctomycetota bacterium]